jgi:MFS family permease
LSQGAPPEKLNVVSKELFLSLYLPATAISLGMGLALPVLPIYAKSFDVSFEVAALVIILNSVGSWAATLPVGWALERFGRRPVLLSGGLMTALTAFLTAAAPTFGLLLACRFLNGNAQQMWQMSRLAMITDTGKDRERGRLITWMMELGRFGNLFSPAVGGFLAVYWDIRVPFVLHGILVLLAILPGFWLSHETDPNRTGGRAEVREREHVPWLDVIRALGHPQMIAFLTAQFMANFTRGVSRGGFLNLYAAYQYGVGPGTLGLLATVNSFIGLPLGFATGYVMDRWGRKRTIVPGFSLLALAMLFMTSTAFFQLPFEVYAIAFLCVSFSSGITGGNMQVMGSDLAPARGRGQWIAIWRFIAESGNQLSPSVFALVSALFGYVGSFGIVGFSALAVSLLVGLGIRETVGRTRDGEEEHGVVEPIEVPPGRVAVVQGAREGGPGG